MNPVDVIRQMLDGEPVKVTESQLRQFLDDWDTQNATIIHLQAALEQLIELSRVEVLPGNLPYINVYDNGTNAEMVQELYDYMENKD